MAKKQVKQVRILYVPGKKDAVNWWEGECFRLETWDNFYNEWCLIRQVACTKSILDPDARENDYIHWEIMKDFFNLVKQGYTPIWETKEEEEKKEE